MTNAYGAASGDGTISNSGMTREAARRRAQEIADQTGETAEVYEEPSGETVDVIEPSERHVSNSPIGRMIRLLSREVQP